MSSAQFGYQQLIGQYFCFTGLYWASNNFFQLSMLEGQYNLLLHPHNAMVTGIYILPQQRSLLKMAAAILHTAARIVFVTFKTLFAHYSVQLDGRK